MVGARIRGMVLALLAPLFLMGCVVVPGRFTATLDIAADRSFAFAYQGEIVALELGDEFARGMKDAGEDSDSEATALHIAARQAAEAPDDATRDERLRALADLLGKEAGYRQAEYKGDGLFQIDYAIRGRLTHNFIWPYNPDAEILFPFLTAELRGPGAVRIKAPAFGETSAAGAPGTENAAERRRGTFTLTTNAEIVSQNNEDGATTQGTRRSIVWDIKPVTKDAPMAVLRVAPVG